MNTGVYAIVNNENQKRYVGSTMSDFDKRYKEHIYYLRKNKHHSPALQNSYNKYGEKSFTLDVLHRVPSQYCRKLEQWYLSNRKCEYNISKSATGGVNQNIVTKQNLLKSLKIYSEYKGCIFTEVNKLSGLTGYQITQIAKGNIYSYYNIDKELISKCIDVKNNCRQKYWKGRKRKASTNKKISEKLKGTVREDFCKGVICLNDGLKYKKIKDCAEAYNLSESNISLCCENEITSCKGYIFEWVNPESEIKYRKTERRVICLNDKKVFRTAKHASNYYGIKKTSIRESCRYKRNTKYNNNKIAFRYYEEKK